jgi:thiol-disulfide isomerase/thioredoxin
MLWWSPVPRRSSLALLLVLTLGTALAAPAATAAGRRLASNDLLEINAMVQDTARAGKAVPRIRDFLANQPDSTYAVFMRQMLLTALVVSHAPGKAVAGLADTVLRDPQRDPLQPILINGEVAQYLVNRGELPAKALAMARTAYRDLPLDPRFDPVRGFALATLGEALSANNRPDTAVTVLQRALEFTADSQRVLSRLGAAYEKLKQDDRAINAYTRALGVFLGRDTSAATPLRALWMRKRGSLTGLEPSVSAARAASRKAVALDSRRAEGTAPDWTLPDLDGKTAKLADFKGKVLVIDFWGTWCGPCRQELPLVQKIYERYRERVAFVGINWERDTGPDMNNRVRSYMTSTGLTFPCVLDADRAAQIAYEVEGFPSLFVIDRSGKIRYKNVGVSDGVEQILSAQIDSLLE